MQPGQYPYGHVNVTGLHQLSMDACLRVWHSPLIPAMESDMILIAYQILMAGAVGAFALGCVLLIVMLIEVASEE